MGKEIISKKATIFALTILFIGVSLLQHTQTTVKADLTDGLIGYWSFNNSNANDESGNGHDGTVYGAMIVAGKSGNAYSFDGVNDYISVSDFTSSYGQGTFVAWVKHSIPVGTTGLVYAEADEDNEINKPYIWFGFDGGKLYFARDVYGMESNYQGKVDVGANDGQWHCVVFLSTESANRFYFDGEEVFLTWQDGNVPTGIWFDDQTTDTNSIGVCNQPMHYGFFNGVIDEVRMYNRVLNQQEIQYLYNNPGGVSSWWNENWCYRKKITIDHTKINSHLEDFPVLINSISSDYKIHAQPDGDDFVFTTDAGVKLNHEIETYDSISGKLVGWVNVVSLSSTEDTIIWLYYGNPNCSNQQNVIGTWDSNYEGVWHLKESAGIRYDSTSNHKDCVASGTTHTTSAKINGGEIFDANADGIHTNSNIIEMTTFTLECWFAFDSTGAGTGDIILQIAENRPAVFRYTDNKLHVWTGYYEEIIVSEHTFDDTDWHYLTLVTTGSEMRLYVDSILEGSNLWSGTSNNELFYLGNNKLDTDTFHGTIDEARVSDNARDENWIQTTYNSINAPETFVSIGAEETVTPNQPPVADAGGPYYSPVDTSITFDGSGSSDTDGMIDGYRWDFTNDGTYDTGWLTSPTTIHSYSSAGTYAVKLEVKDNDGDFNTETTTATITSESGAVPTAEANGPYTGYVNHPVSCSSTGSLGGSEGFITSWYWTFGDNQVSSQQNPSHTYTSTGIFTVTLKVTNNYGQTNTDTTSATISQLSPNQTPPVADAGGPYTGVINSPIAFDGSGSNDADGTIVSYVWNFGDSTTGTGVSPTHTYTIPGNYTVILTVTDNESLTHSNSTIARINVSGPPTIVISVDLSNIEPIEEGNEKTFSVMVQCEHQPVSNIRLEILEQSNLTIISLPSNISLNPGESRELLITIKAPALPENASKETIGDETIILRAVATGNVTSNNETVNFKVIKTDATPGFETIATLAAVGSAGAMVTFFRRRHRKR